MERSRGRNASPLILFAAVAMMMAGQARAQPGTVFGRNLVVNGTAEMGAGTADASMSPMPPPGWTVTGNFTAAQYGGTGGLPAVTDPGPANRGVNFFAGGRNTPVSSARQAIDLGPGAAVIDGGTVRYRLAGYLGGYSSQEDHAVVTARFKDAYGRQLALAVIGPVTATERGNQTGLLPRVSMGTVPAGTRAVEVVITATRFDGAYNDGYSDNIALILTP